MPNIKSLHSSYQSLSINEHTGNPQSLEKNTQVTSRILGHRGARGVHLENSFEGFRYLQNLFNSQQLNKPHPYLAGVEFDVQLTADKQLVVFHDDNLQRLYGLDHRVDELTLKELLAITQTHQPLISNTLLHHANDVDNDKITKNRETRENKTIAHNSISTHPILPLNDIWSLMKGYGRIEVEVKTHARTNIDDMVHALSSSLQPKSLPHTSLNLHDHPITLTSFNTALLTEIQKCSELRKYPIGLLIEADDEESEESKDTNKHIDSIPNNLKLKRQNKLSCADRAIEQAKFLQCHHIGFRHDLIDPDTVKLCRQHDITISAWTVNNPQRVIELADMSVDYIISDYPELMLSL